MGTLGRTAQVSTGPLISSPLQRFPSPFFIAKGTKYAKVRCASYLPKWREGRRLFSISLVLSPLFLIPDNAIAGSFFDKYVKRKKLDPLEAYVPAIILTQLQMKDLEKTLELDQPQFATCRSLLRSGPFASFRVNIRAVAQYASDAGEGSTPFNDVDQCLRALEELDSLLLHASRNDPEASVNEMKAKIVAAVNALNSLLKTIPSDMFEKGQAAANAYRALEEDTKPEILDPELKQLESIL